MNLESQGQPPAFKVRHHSFFFFFLINLALVYMHKSIESCLKCSLFFRIKQLPFGIYFLFWFKGNVKLKLGYLITWMHDCNEKPELFFFFFALWLVTTTHVTDLFISTKIETARVFSVKETVEFYSFKWIRSNMFYWELHSLSSM